MKAVTFIESDYDQLIDWIESEQVLHQWGSPSLNFPPNKEQLIKVNKSKKDKRLSYKGTFKGETVAYGEIGCIDEVNCSGRLCRILIDNKRRGEGLGILWIKTLLETGFTELKLNRMELNVYDQNKRAIKCYKQAGLQIEGLLRETYRVKGGYWSVYHMSILRSEWLEQTTLQAKTANIFN